MRYRLTWTCACGDKGECEIPIGVTGIDFPSEDERTRYRRIITHLSADRSVHDLDLRLEEIPKQDTRPK
jgi:hypothetical protein